MDVRMTPTTSWSRSGLAGLILFVSWFVSWLVPAGGALAESEMDARVRNLVTTHLAPAATSSGAGGLAVAVYVAGHVQFFDYGRADSKQAITPDTLFNLASLRKLFEATLVALGTLRGELSLDDPVSKYVGELHADYVSRITIGELVTHTSGVLLPTDHPPWPSESYTLAQFFDMLNAWGPQAGEEPGRQRIYTHAGYVLLQLVLERRYGRPIHALIESRILKPLGMHATYLPKRGPDNRAVMPFELLQETVQGYSDQGMPIGPRGGQQSYFDFPGTGQMFSSARDLSILLAALLGGKVSDPVLREALQMTQRETFQVSAKFGQAMAWETVHLDGVDIVDKPGGLNNASAYIGLVPARKIGIVLLANRGNFPHENARYEVLPALSH
jgi:beta-lactamase class C